MWGGRTICSRIVNYSGKSFYDADAGQNSCAIRMSIAFYLAGTQLKLPPGCKDYWVLDFDKKIKLPSEASAYRDSIKGAKSLTGTEDDIKKELKGKIGLIYFGGGFETASGHITLWNNNKCVHGADDEFFEQEDIRFWGMKL
jgi:hypothetical protein